MRRGGPHRFGPSPRIELREGEQPLRGANVRRVLALFRPHRGRVAAATGLVLITALLGVVNPLMQKVIFDQVFVPAVARTSSGRLAIEATPGLADHLLRTLALFVGVMVLGGVQLIMIGVVGEYIGKILAEIKGRPVYFVAEHEVKLHDAVKKSDARTAAE